MLQVKCPKCQKALRAHEKYAGKRILCPQCREEFCLPDVSPAPEATAAASQPGPTTGGKRPDHPGASGDPASSAGGVRIGRKTMWIGAGAASVSLVLVGLVILLTSGEDSSSPDTRAPAQPTSSKEDFSGAESEPGPPPLVDATVRGEFHSSNSSHGNTTTLRLGSRDRRTWKVVPDMLFAEAYETTALAGALCLKSRYPVRDRCVPFDVAQAPSDRSGSVSVKQIVPLGGDRVDIVYTGFRASWRPNGKENLWEETTLRRGDCIECDWWRDTHKVFKSECKEPPKYRQFHLGPVLYRGDDNGVAFVLVADTGRRVKDDEWECQRPTFVPLSLQSIRKQVEDQTRPLAWRAQFLALGWHQPRPARGIDAYLLTVLEGATDHPTWLRRGAAQGLIARKYAPAKQKLLSLAANKEAGKELRNSILGSVSSMVRPSEIGRIAAIARDTRDWKDVREDALMCLMQLGDEGRSVVSSLRGDPKVGEKVKELLKKQQ